MTNQQPKPVSLRDIDIGYYIRHYLTLFWRWKWYIFIVGPLVAGGWITYVLKAGAIRPELTATALIGLEDAGNISAVRDVGETGHGRVELIRSRNFLAEIVDTLSLRLIMKQDARHEIFDSIWVDSTAAMGRYVFDIDKRDKTAYKLSYWNQQFGYEDKLLKTGRLVTLDTIQPPGMLLDFGDEFLKQPRRVVFFVVRDRDAVDLLRKNMKIERGNKQYVPVSLKGRDYHLITKTINTIVDHFVARNLHFRKRKTAEVLSVLQKQLERASEQLNAAELSLKRYREANPTIGLGNDALSSLNEMTDLESTKLKATEAKEQAQELADRYRKMSENERGIIIDEIVAFLQSRTVPGAMVLNNELREQKSEINALRSGYSKNHPMVAEAERKIDRTNAKILDKLNAFIKDIATRIEKSDKGLGRLSHRLQSLPAKEMRLAELERQRQINSQIHTTVLSRYNQAKIANAVEVADVFVMDHAVAPHPPPDFISMLLRIAFGMVLGFGAAFAPPLAVDLFDKTARTETEVKRMLDYTVIECIPSIESADGKKKRKRKDRNAKDGIKGGRRRRKIDEKLITADYAPNFVNELFRSLRAKIMLRTHNCTKRKLAVTSLNMGEGKSLISANVAITTAQQKLRTLLMDGDLRRGVLHNSFVLRKRPGLSTLLFSEDPITSESLTDFIQETHVPNLHLMSSGPNVPNPSELLASPRLQTALDRAFEMFDVVIMDTPPLGVAADAAVLKNWFDNYLVVIKAGTTNLVDLQKRIAEFPGLSDRIMGLILNHAVIDRRLRSYRYSNYTY
ncbi:MAG: polysaccharide biosynthesis tyrosine autokinase [Chitinivibrionales bacterium]|nr:polysaccharide biosynthesis tyrosine autokinase [Chitinivibrionales bacterium]MBD3356030.1 polysaccharide biosynthesis tyrosine autokinase [Chitinivibrionales bacterium]